MPLPWFVPQVVIPLLVHPSLFQKTLKPACCSRASRVYFEPKSPPSLPRTTAMQFSQDDFDRLLLSEHSRKTAEAHYAKNPLDADNLVKWAGALLELSQFQSVADSKIMLNDCISKLEEALVINPTKHEALWCLGNAHTSHGFMTPDLDEARPYFEKASVFFQRAAEEEPGNELYQKSIEVTAKAPELHMEIHKQGMAQQTLGGGPASSSSGKSSKAKRSSDLKYDICGWIILAVGIVAWVGLGKSNIPPPPPPR